MRQIQATEAKARLAQLLKEVEAGERVAITRHGRIVAHIVPAQLQEQAERLDKIEQFKAARKRWKKTGISARQAMEWRHEGHRH